jgi:quinol monooxygenase YgiN
MVIVTGSILAKPETFEELRRVSLAHTLRSRTEAGCEQHDVHSDVENALRLVFVERWTDRATLLAHFAEPNARAFIAQARKLAAEPPSISIYTADEISFSEFLGQ